MNRFATVFALFYAFFVAILHPGLLESFGVSDDFYLSLIASNFGGHSHVQVATFYNGRPLNGAWLALTYPWLDSVELLWITRLVTIAAVAGSAALLSRHLYKHLGFTALNALVLSVLIFTLPGLVSFALWYSAATCAFGLLIATVSSVVADKAVGQYQSLLQIIRTAWPQLMLAALLQTFAMLFYQASAMFYVVLPLIGLLFLTNMSIGERLIRTTLLMTVMGIGIFASFVIVKFVLVGFIAPEFITYPNTFHAFSLNLDIAKNLTALKEIEATGAALWFVDGRRSVVILVRTLIVLGFAFHILRNWRMLTQKYDRKSSVILILIYAAFIIGLVVIVPNLVNLLAYSYNSYTRHTVVFSATLIVLGWRFFIDGWHFIDGSKFVNASICRWSVCGLALVVVAVMFTRIDDKVSMHAAEWRQALAKTESIKPLAMAGDVKIGVIFPEFDYKRWGIGAGTLHIPTHAFLLVYAAFAENKFLQHDYRYRDTGFDYIRIGKDTQSVTFTTRYGSLVTMDFTANADSLLPSGYQKILDFR